MAREMVLGVEAVLADGTVVNGLNKMIKNNAGYDLKHLFIGSEGTLGVITRIVLKLFPKPASRMTAMCAVQDFDGVLGLLQAARSGLGPLLSAFEVMWPDYWQTATTHLKASNPFAGDNTPYGAYVLVEALGTDAQTDAPMFERWLERLLEQGVVANAVIAQSVAEEKKLWGVRDATGEFFSYWPGHVPFDIGLPIARMDEFVRRCKEGLAQRLPGAQALYYGHIGDGNIHLVIYQSGVEQQPKQAMEEVVYGLIKEMDGTVSAEHGIGTYKLKWLGHARSPEQIALMRVLKQAMDPKGILNPGKVF